MKKLLIICTIAAFAVACNNNADSDKTDLDSIKPDTSIPSAGDTTKMNLPDTANNPDTISKDTLIK